MLAVREIDVKRKKEVKSEAQWCNERDEDDAMCLLSHYFTVGLFGSKSEFFLGIFLDSINGFLTLERKDLKKFSSIQIRTLSIKIMFFVQNYLLLVFCVKFFTTTLLPWHNCHVGKKANDIYYWPTHERPILSIQYNCKNALPLVKKWPKKKIIAQWAFV